MGERQRRLPDEGCPTIATSAAHHLCLWIKRSEVRWGGGIISGSFGQGENWEIENTGWSSLSVKLLPGHRHIDR